MNRSVPRWFTVFALAMMTSAAAAQELRPVVVELFTSQGCSSCPPADAFLRELADRPGVLALSEHVDYWDHLGWKDPFASPVASQRQRAYAHRLGLRYVYTPQMIINGVAQAAGTERDAVLAAISRLERLPQPPLSAREGPKGQLSIEIGHAEQPVTADVLMVTFDRSQSSDVSAGENSGRNLRYRHVVRRIDRLEGWTGTAMALTAPMAQSTSQQETAVLLQESGVGAILGAARVVRSD